MSAVVTPRFAISCSRELMQRAAELAAATGQYIQTHFAETTRETARVKELHGEDYIKVYGSCGLLTPRTILAHAVHLDAESRADIARAGAIIAHCPTANRFLRAGTFNRAACLRAPAMDNPIRITLGSDIAAAG